MATQFEWAVSQLAEAPQLWETAMRQLYDGLLERSDALDRGGTLAATAAHLEALILAAKVKFSQQMSKVEASAVNAKQWGTKSGAAMPGTTRGTKTFVRPDKSMLFGAAKA